MLGAAPEKVTGVSRAGSLAPEVSSEHSEVTSHHPQVSSEPSKVTSHRPEVGSDHPEVTSHHPEVSSEAPKVTSHLPEVSSKHPEVTSPPSGSQFQALGSHEPQPGNRFASHETARPEGVEPFGAIRSCMLRANNPGIDPKEAHGDGEISVVELRGSSGIALPPDAGRSESVNES